jgi:hypothetical protein
VIGTPLAHASVRRRRAFPLRWIGALHERRALRAARRTADEELLLSSVPPLRLAWRAAELVVPKNRLGLARSVRGLVRDADARSLPGPAPIDRLAVRAASPALMAVAARLDDLEHPVSPRGVLLVDRLLRDPDGPVYRRGEAGELDDAVETASRALELP